MLTGKVTHQLTSLSPVYIVMMELRCLSDVTGGLNTGVIDIYDRVFWGVRGAAFG